MVYNTGVPRRHQARRWKANSIERSRMHCLNAALDMLRLRIPIDPALCQHSGAHQKLSKIETLRMSINYILALQETLHQNRELDLHTFWRVLTKGLSPQTSQLVAASLHLYSQTYSPEASLHYQPELADRRQSWVTRWRQSLHSSKSSSLVHEQCQSVQRKDELQPCTQWRAESSQYAQWSEESTEYVQWRGETVDPAQWRRDLVDGAQWKGDPVDGAQWKGDPVDGAQWKGDPVDGAQWRGDPVDGAQWKGDPVDGAQLKGGIVDHSQWREGTLDHRQLKLRGETANREHWRETSADPPAQWRGEASHWKFATNYKPCLKDNKHVIRTEWHKSEEANCIYGQKF